MRAADATLNFTLTAIIQSLLHIISTEFDKDTRNDTLAGHKIFLPSSMTCGGGGSCHGVIYLTAIIRLLVEILQDILHKDSKRHL